ncbi:hypothetical protein PCANC_18701 [Puccinia coronata f. sp. avenae]|uniref:SCA7 domain-containing protein n=1 Tax=Puccinia coronata f. sp. avenae TaxID=200324 RepID=A0A2N5TYZ6_9BASI|nr:hypothetical protein PCANC_18701 [Puccinia coronata f. sp. avenae]
MQLKPSSSKAEAKLKAVATTIDALKQNPAERWKTIKLLTKQQQPNTSLSTEPHHHPPLPTQDHPATPVWTQRMETLFGPLNDQLRLIKCDHCGILTRETNSKVGVTHKLNCEMLKKSGLNGAGGILSKKFGLGSHFSNLESSSKKRASSEVSLESIPMKKKKKTMIIDHTQTGAIDPDAPNVINGVVVTPKQMKKAIALAERTEREKERKEKKRLEEEARKAKKLSRAKGGPVNVNEQCGVLVPPNDTPCARSLTCKTHSMGAKRSVPGRSAPYDVLLNEWQKKNNPNWGDRKVVTPRVGPGIEPGISKKKKKELASLANKNPSNGGNKGNEDDPSSGSAQNNNNNSNNNNNNGNNKNPVGNGSGANNKHQKSGQVKDKSSSSGHHHASKSGGGDGKVPSGAGGHPSGGTKKAGGHTGQPSAKGDHRTTSAKLSAVNEAKLLGELDADFYLVIPPKAERKKAAGPRPVDRDGDTAMAGDPPALADAAPPPDGPSPTRATARLQKQADHDHDQDHDHEDGSANESDSEFEAVIRGLIVAQNLLKPATLLSSDPPQKSSFPPPPSCSYSLHSNPWSKFSKLGVKESFKNSFKL